MLFVLSMQKSMQVEMEIGIWLHNLKTARALEKKLKVYILNRPIEGEKKIYVPPLTACLLWLHNNSAEVVDLFFFLVQPFVFMCTDHAVISQRPHPAPVLRSHFCRP